MEEVKCKKSRGKVAPGKRQVNIRLRSDLLEKAQAEAVKLYHDTRKWIRILEDALEKRYYH